ncbi:unnamed protein product [Pylaiella littoralis]
MLVKKVDRPPVDEALLDKVRRNMSKALASEKFIKGMQQNTQQLNGVACTGEKGSKSRGNEEKRMAEMVEQVEKHNTDLEVTRKEARQAHKAATKTQAQADCDAHQAWKAVKQAQELAASAQAQIFQEAQQEFARALEAAGKNDSKAAEDAGRRVAALVEEVGVRNQQTQRDIQQTAAVVVEEPVMMIPGRPAAVKWVLADREGGPLRATYEARQTLMEIPNGQLLNILTILGPARKGKSFLMNSLTGFENVFGVSPDVKPCTEGADLSPFLMPLSDFMQGGGAHSGRGKLTPSEPIIALVDMEGQGDKSTEHGVRLATTFLVVSKVVIYNWMSLPNKNTMLQDLLLMVKAAEKVVDKGKYVAAFGHLIILVRDVAEKAKEIKELVMGYEDMAAGLSWNDEAAVSDRNRIRKRLQEVFESIDVHTMPSPHADIAQGAVPLSTVTPEFSTSLDELRRTISQHLASPHTFAQRQIAGGQHINNIVGALCEAINETGNICPPSVLDAIDMAKAEQEVQYALVQFDDMLGSTLGGDFTLSTLETTTALEDASKIVYDQFKAATEGISASIAENAKQELEKRLLPKAEVVAGNQESKRHELKNRMRAIACQHEADIAQEARALSIPMDETVLEGIWKQLVSAHFVALEEALQKMVTTKGDITENDVVRTDLLEELGWAMSRKEFEDLNIDTHLSLQGLNRSAAAGKEDREARKRAEETTKQLAEQADKLQKEVQVAQKQANEAETAAREAQAKASRDAQKQSESLFAAMMPMMMMAGMGGGGGGITGGGVGYSGMGGGSNYMGGGTNSAGGSRNLTFYRGGQFVPGGGRSPKGGGWF